MPQFLGARDCLRVAAGAEETRAAIIQEGDGREELWPGGEVEKLTITQHVALNPIQLA